MWILDIELLGVICSIVGDNWAKILLCDALAGWPICRDVLQLPSYWLHWFPLWRDSGPSVQQSLLCWRGVYRWCQHLNFTECIWLKLLIKNSEKIEAVYLVFTLLKLEDCLALFGLYSCVSLSLLGYQSLFSADCQRGIHDWIDRGMSYSRLGRGISAECCRQWRNYHFWVWQHDGRWLMLTSDSSFGDFLPSFFCCFWMQKLLRDKK